MLAQLNRVLVVDSSNDGSLLSDADFVVLVCFCVISMFAIRYSMFSRLRISAVQISLFFARLPLLS
jgi:hypothetical protein